jgi:hypothetical protein
MTRPSKILTAVQICSVWSDQNLSEFSKEVNLGRFCFTRCAVVRERGLSSGRVGLASGGSLGTRMLSHPRAGAWVA